MMDNFHIDVNGQGKASLLLALQLAANGGGHDFWYVYRTPERLTLLWTEDDRATPLNGKKTADEVVELAWGWLQNEAAYPDKPCDSDISSAHAFRVFTEGSWGHVPDFGYKGICCVEPTLALYGK